MQVDSAVVLETVVEVTAGEQAKLPSDDRDEADGKHRLIDVLVRK